MVFDAQMQELVRIRELLSQNGIKVANASSDSNFTGLLHKIQPDLLIICSYRRPPSDKINIIKKVRSVAPQLPIVLLNRYSSEAKVLNAFRAGVKDCERMQASDSDLMDRIRRYLMPLPSEAKPDKTGALKRATHEKKLIGNSKPIREVKAYLKNLAFFDCNVFITGETGTGKNLIAEIIHHQSQRRANPFICVNCAAIPDNLVESELFGYEKGAFTGAHARQAGKFELADNGTILLDEIGEMKHHIQAKFLTALETKQIYHLGSNIATPIHARIIAATNYHLKHLMASGAMRKDLFFRLNVARIDLPPLRERKDDIPELVNYAIAKMNAKFGSNIKGVSDNAMTAFMRYDWPGNIRELFNFLEAQYISFATDRCDYIHLPKSFRIPVEKDEGRKIHERQRIVKVLKQTGWNKSNAAKKLNLSRMTLYRKMSKYKIVEQRNRSDHHIH